MSSPRDAAVRQAERRLVLGNTQSHVLRFAEHDTDGNQELDFDEFYAMQPKHLLETFSTEQIRGWFDEADRDGSGTLCINEFFMWSLQDASAQFGSKALQSAFERYDRDNTGQLDAMEFGKAWDLRRYSCTGL